MAKAILRLLGGISQEASGSCAELAFRCPPRSARTSRDERALAEATRLRVRSPQGELAVWLWGTGPRVLLVHGWGGHAARLRHFVSPLLEAGFGVMAFDAPAHGLSRGSLSTLPDFVDAIEAVSRVANPVALVGHSMGAAACALALRQGLAARAAVLLSPPAEPEEHALRFARYLGLSPAAATAMTSRLEARYGVRWSDLRLAEAGPELPTLVFHDERDHRVPIREGRAIAASWPNAQLIATRGLGHHRILHSRKVVARAVAFLAGSVADGSRAFGNGTVLETKTTAAQLRVAFGG